VSSPGDPNRVTGNGPAAQAALRPHDRRDPWPCTGPTGVICGVGLVIPLTSYGRYEGGLVRQPSLGTIGGCRTSLRHLSYLA